MGMDQPPGRSGIRARAVDHAKGPGGRSVFRIEDKAGRVLRKIKGARDPQEALALYWRRSGAAGLVQAGLGAAMSKDLERRIRQARAGVRTDMQTPQLPFGVALPEAVPAGAETEIARPTRRGRPPQAALPQTDLFGAEIDRDRVPVAMAMAMAVDGDADVDPGPSPVVIDPEPQAAAEVEAEPYTLDPQTIGLLRVDARNLRPTDRADNYLYHVTNGPDAEGSLRSGLLVSASDPIILTERQGVAYWLSVLADDYDYILDGPADFVVLRLRRMAVEELLEHDLQASRSAGCACYLLTGGSSFRSRD